MGSPANHPDVHVGDEMPPKAPKAPPVKATKEEHKKHAEAFLALDDYKDPKKVNKPEYRDMSDEAKE
jgi:hypothetical protein